MFDILFDAVLVSLPWEALVPMSLHEDSVEKLRLYMRAVHSDQMACPAKLCSEDNGLNGS